MSHIDDIVKLADGYLGGPQVIACRGCHQKNRVSPGAALVKVARCGKCGLPLPVTRPTKKS